MILSKIPCIWYTTEKICRNEAESLTNRYTTEKICRNEAKSLTNRYTTEKIYRNEAKSLTNRYTIEKILQNFKRSKRFSDNGIRILHVCSRNKKSGFV